MLSHATTWVLSFLCKPWEWNSILYWLTMLIQSNPCQNILAIWENNFYKTPLFLTNLQPVSHLTIPIPKCMAYNFSFSHKILKFLRKFVNVFRFSLFRKFRNKFEKFTSFNNFEDFPFTLTWARDETGRGEDDDEKKNFLKYSHNRFSMFEDRNPQKSPKPSQTC